MGWKRQSIFQGGMGRATMIVSLREISFGLKEIKELLVLDQKGKRTQEEIFHPPGLAGEILWESRSLPHTFLPPSNSGGGFMLRWKKVFSVWPRIPLYPWKGAVSMVWIRRGKPGDKAAIARVHVDTWKYSYQGLVRQQFLESLSREKAVQTWQKIFAEKNPGQFIFVAEDQKEGIIGFISGGRSRDEESYCDAEIYALYIMPHWQGQGVGRKLMEKVKSFLKGQGLKSFYLWTLAAGKSRRFYENLGGKWIASKQEVIGEVEYPMVGYAWEIERAEE